MLSGLVRYAWRYGHMPRAYTSLCGNIDLGIYRMRRTRLNYSFEKARRQHLAVLFFIQTCNKLLEYFLYLDTIKAILFKREKVK